jgi:DNA repair protein RadA/Sms
MARTRTIFTCQNCGSQSAKWLGRCPDCGAWNSYAEEQLTPASPKGRGELPVSQPLPLLQVPSEAEARVSSGLGELDRVLGGGVVDGSFVLLGGDPGIGKSTLLLQAAQHLAAAYGRVLYVSAEESPRQLRLRGERLGTSADGILILAETSVERIITAVHEAKPAVLIVDSIQTVHTAALESAPGSVGQVRESAGRLMLLAKGSAIPTFIVGHVTKDGAIAGPRVLEHMVDTVLYFEGDNGHPYRILRAVKNRFGSTNEIGVFEMKGDGLREVANPSELFLSERPGGVAGSIVTATMEGSRPLLVEMQALVSGTSFGTPRRTATGFDQNRLSLLVAVLEKKVGLHLAGCDIFCNAAGGVRLTEPAVDLGVAAAVASSHLDRAADPGTVVIGEVGLAGEVRAVARPELRIREAAKLGFTRCVLPSGNLKHLDVAGIELVGVGTVREALQEILGA